MVILIAPIGFKTDHIKTWLREEKRPIQVLWLIHSKKNERADFPQIAQRLEEDLSRSYDRLVIKKTVIDDPLSVDPTIDAIHKIILHEEDSDPSVIRQDFAINITGGTNVMGAAALLAATFFGTKAYYVREPQTRDSKGMLYVDELPVQPIGSAKLNANQLRVLKIIVESYYEIEGGPSSLERKRIYGSITRSKLLEALGWNEKIKGRMYNRREGSTRLLGITKKLVESGLINKIPHVERYVNTANKEKEIINDGYIWKMTDKTVEDNWIIKRIDNEVRFEITAAGRRRARDAFMF